MAQVPPDSEYVFIWIRTGWIGVSWFTICNLIILIGACITVFFRIKNRSLMGLGAAWCSAFTALHLGGYANQILMQFPNIVIFYGGLTIVFILPSIEKDFETYEKWYGVDGAPVSPTGNVFVAQEIAYDENGRVSEYRYLDENDRPVKCSAGYEIQGRAYDEYGNVSEFAYLYREYDEHKHIIRQAFYDTNHAPIQHKNGYAAYTQTFTESGKVHVITYFDAKGEATEIKGGYSKVEYVYNGEDVLLKVVYTNLAGETVKEENK